MTSHLIPACERTPCRKALSQCQFNHLIVGMRHGNFNGNRETSFDGLQQVGAKLIHRFGLRRAAWYGGNFGPEPTLFGSVHDGLNCHRKMVEAAGVEPASEK